MNPLEEYEMKKEALFGNLGRRAAIAGKTFMSAATGRDAMKTLGRNFQAGAGMAAGGAAIGGLAAAGKKIMGASHARRDFGLMMETHPDLQDIQEQNPKFFNQAYKSLRRMNPTYASDPMIAGSYMKKMMASPDAAGLTLAQSFKQPTPVSQPGVDVQGQYGPLRMQF